MTREDEVVEEIAFDLRRCALISNNLTTISFIKEYIRRAYRLGAAHSSLEDVPAERLQELREALWERD